MASHRSLSYRETGVLDNTQLGLSALLGWVNRTKAFRPAGRRGHGVLDVGFFASVVDLGNKPRARLCTDGVGSKVLIAEMLQRYDTIGIDCVAMNVNDAICVGAEPISFLDYVAIERATPAILEEIGKGLHEGARLAGVTIVGGEISQLPEIIKGHGPGQGLDLVGMCAGLVPLDRVIVGREVAPGDVVVGVRSSGIHSNGLTLPGGPSSTRGSSNRTSTSPGWAARSARSSCVPLTSTSSPSSSSCRSVTCRSGPW